MISSFLSISLFAAAAAVQPGPVKPRVRAALIQPLTPTAVTVTATPATITFTAMNPATTLLVPGNATAVVSWSNGFSAVNPWNLTVGANATLFGGCPGVPISAVTVTCSSASVGGFGTGACSGAFPLTTLPTRVASGNENIFPANYTVNLTFTLADSWKYIATSGQTCSLTLTYNATLN